MTIKTGSKNPRVCYCHPESPTTQNSIHTATRIRGTSTTRHPIFSISWGRIIPLRPLLRRLQGHMGVQRLPNGVPVLLRCFERVISTNLERGDVLPKGVSLKAFLTCSRVTCNGIINSSLRRDRTNNQPRSCSL
jgi:hypothetical protein